MAQRFVQGQRDKRTLRILDDSLIIKAATMTEWVFALIGQLWQLYFSAALLLQLALHRCFLFWAILSF